MAEMTHLPRIEHVCVYLLLVLTIVSCQCNRGRIIHTLTFRNCQPKRLLSWGCSGTCPSYSRPSSTNPEDVEHVCECCKNTEFETKMTILRCPSSDGQSLRRIAVRVNIPNGCTCRPCSALPNQVTAGEDQVLIGKRAPYKIQKNIAPYVINETLAGVN